MMMSNPTRERKLNFARFWFLGQILGCCAYLLVCMIFIFQYSRYGDTIFFGGLYTVAAAFFIMLSICIAPMCVNTYFYFCLKSFAD